MSVFEGMKRILDNWTTTYAEPKRNSDMTSGCKESGDCVSLLTGEMVAVQRSGKGRR